MIRRRDLKPLDVRERIRAYISDEAASLLDLKLVEAGTEWAFPADLAAHLPAVFVRLDSWQNNHDPRLRSLRTLYRLELTYIRALSDDDTPGDATVAAAAELTNIFTRDDYDWPYRLESAQGYTVESVFPDGAEFPDPTELQELEIRLEICQIPLTVTVVTQHT